MAKNDTITAEYLRSILDYEPETGLFRWKTTRHGRVKVGQIAGNVNPGHGYVIIEIDGKPRRAHRLAVLWMTGEWPERDVDHENLIRHDNRWGNIRPATEQQNGANRRALKNNACGFKGVYRAGNRWRANIRVDYKLIHLGYSDTKEGAAKLYADASSLYFGKYARLG